jgi:hypothetical protein
MLTNSFRYTGSYILAGSENVSRESLHSLSTHGNPAVRRRLAENPCTPHEILMMLALDENTEVRAALAWNATAHADVLERLCLDEDVNVRLALTENHRLQKELLELLAKDDNPYVQHHARRSLEVVALEAQLKSESFCALEGDEAKLGELIVALGLLNEKSMRLFVETAKEKNLPLGHVLIRDGGLSKSIVGKALRMQCRVRENRITFDQAVAELRSE